MADLFPITLADQIACVEREIRMRKKVYPRWVGQGNMTQEAADREIAVMTEVLATLKGLREAPRHPLADQLPFST